jgi:hypothetical protein
MTTNLQKKKKNFAKFRILKLKRANNSYGYPTDFVFARTDKNFKLPSNVSKIYQNIPNESKLILIYTVLNKK